MHASAPYRAYRLLWDRFACEHFDGLGDAFTNQMYMSTVNLLLQLIFGCALDQQTILSIIGIGRVGGSIRI